MVILHGETIITKINSLPKDVIGKKASGKYQIIAESEQSGNHHVIDLVDGVEFYEKDGTLYLKNEKETQVRCVVNNRHDSVTIEPGIWEIDFQQEYDYLTEQKQRVSD